MLNARVLVLVLNTRQHSCVQQVPVPSARYYKLRDFSFNDLPLTDDDTLRACLRMFLDLNIVERFNIDYQTLCRWLLSVKKNYRYSNAFHFLSLSFSTYTTHIACQSFAHVMSIALILSEQIAFISFAKQRLLQMALVYCDLKLRVYANCARS